MKYYIFIPRFTIGSWRNGILYQQVLINSTQYWAKYCIFNSHCWPKYYIRYRHFNLIFWVKYCIVAHNVESRTVNLTVRANPTKRESQRTKLERYFLECVSEPLPLNSTQSMRARRLTGKSGHTTRYRQLNHTRAQSADKQQTNNREPPITSRYQVDK